MCGAARSDSAVTENAADTRARVAGRRGGRGCGPRRGGSGALDWAGRLLLWAAGFCWAGLALGFWAPFLFLFYLSFLFLIQTKFEFKYEFEFKPHSNKKNMHQHECNTNFFLNLGKFLITCETKLNLMQG